MAKSTRSSVKAHVTFGDSKRIIILSKGDGLAELRQGFLRTFLDELSDDASQVKVKFQRHNDEFEDYEDLTPDVILKGNTKIKAFIATSKNEESKKTMATEISHWEQAGDQRKTSPFGAYHCEPLTALYLGVSPDWRWFPCCSTEPPATHFAKSHRINKDVTYQLWSLMKQGVIVLNDSKKGEVCTDGEVGAVDSNNSVQTNFIGRGNFQLEFNAANGPLSITAAVTGTTISVTDSPGKNAYFQPICYWAFTMFRCLGRTPVDGNTAMYLGCNSSDNLAVLVQVNEEYDHPGSYPDPRTLFIATRA